MSMINTCRNSGKGNNCRFSVNHLTDPKEVTVYASKDIPKYSEFFVPFQGLMDGTAAANQLRPHA